MPRYWKSKTNTQRRQYSNIEVGGNPTSPQKDEPREYDTLISTKALRDLPKSPISMQVDPYQNALPGTEPYPLLRGFNKVAGGRYAGDKNLDGGTTIQYSNSQKSGFLKVFDTAMLKIGLNYRYLPILTSDTSRGNYMIDEMRKAISEVCSTFAATTFYNQNIYYYAIETNLPMGSAVPTTVSGGKKVYTDIQDVIYAMGIMYQLYLQKVALVFNQFNYFRMKQGPMIRMSFNRETPSLNAFFGLTNKKAFLAMFDSLGYTIEGEYLDTDFMVQANVLALSSSRRSNSINDPLLEVHATFNSPNTFKMYVLPDYAAKATASTVLPSPIFDSVESMKYQIGTELNENNQEVPVYRTFDEACDLLSKNCTVTDTLQYIRTTALRLVTSSQNSRFNDMKKDLDVLTNCMTTFKIAFADFRTVLDVVTRSGLNQWKKGVKLKVTVDTDCDILQNLVVDNIYQLVLSGCDTVKFDNNTKRWSIYTLWNQYYGIPEHDAYSGGIFLTLSTKQPDYLPGDDTNVGYMPKAFDVKTSDQGTYVKAVNREGNDAPITYITVTGSDNKVYARLFPLDSQAGYVIRVPSLNMSTADMNDKYTKAEVSFIYKFMLQIFGMGSIPQGANSHDFALDSDLFSIYDIQITDFTNEVITYARSKGPFVVNAVDSTNLGFYGMKLGSK